MPDHPGSAAVAEKLKMVQQLRDRGRAREALALALEVLEAETRRLQESFQVLQEKMRRGRARPWPDLEPQAGPSSPLPPPPRVLH